MKKLILFCSMAAMLLAGTSCANKGANLSADDKVLSDSISMLAGTSMGYDINRQWAMFIEQQDSASRAKFNKAEFMRGFQAAIKTDTTSQSYVMGFNVGLNGWQFAMRQNQSVPVDIAAFAKAFEKAFMADSVPAEASAKASQEFQQIMGRMQELMAKKAAEAKANSPEAKQNKDAGEAYVNKAKAADSAIKTTQSGLSYKIENPGTEPKVAANDNVTIKYVGKLIDGTEFDRNDDGVTLRANNFVPGFTEGLMLLGKGGKATLYIPGELAYGVDGIPQAGIGPNATLVFDVEVVDVTPEAAE